MMVIASRKLVAVGLALVVHVVPASAQPVRSLAYEDAFVWYLSGRLASDLVVFQKKIGIDASETQWSDHRAQYEILYHYYLVECEGPLPKLAKIFGDFDPAVDSDIAGYRAMTFVGTMDHAIWPVIQEWNGRVLLQLLDTYAKGKYGFFPPCIIDGFARQNPFAKS
jgi:hypothetical protein